MLTPRHPQTYAPSVEESKALAALRRFAAGGPLPAPASEADAAELARQAQQQGLASLVLAAIDHGSMGWPAAIVGSLESRRRADLVRGLRQAALGARVGRLLADHDIRSMPLKGVVLAQTVYEHEADRPMADVDLLALERWPQAIEALRDAGFDELVRADHAVALREPASGLILELHGSVCSAPGLFPIDHEGLWRRRRAGVGQLPCRPSAEDLLLQLALHGAFQHGWRLSLVQWLDIRRLLERDPPDPVRAFALAIEARATAALAATLLLAGAVVDAPVGAELQERARQAVPPALLRWLEPRLVRPLDLLEQPPPLARVRAMLVPGRRLELVWHTLVWPATACGATGLRARARHALRRAVHLSGTLVAAPAPPPEAPGSRVPAARPERQRSRRAGEPGRGGTAEGRGLAEAALRDCLADFPAVRFTVTGRCMDPVIRDGDRVVLAAPSRHPPRFGDIVLVRQEDGLRLHRLVWCPSLAGPRRSWRTRADRGDRLDPPFSSGDLLGSVVAVERAGISCPRDSLRALRSLLAGALAGLRWRRARRSSARLPHPRSSSASLTVAPPRD